jgi:hypothetical protein
LSETRDAGIGVPLTTWRASSKMRCALYAVMSMGVGTVDWCAGPVAARAWSKPVAITVILICPCIAGSTTAPKMMFASSCAAL